MPLSVEPSEKQAIVSELSRWAVFAGVFAFQLVSLVALTGSSHEGPSYLGSNTNLLDPWATWCGNGCYGISWVHWGGPYSIFWYWTNAGLTLNGFLPYTPMLMLGNILIQIRLGLSKTGLLFACNCLFVLNNWPQNMVIVWLVFLGFYTKYGLILAPIFKLPVGSFQLWVWKIVFDSNTALRDSGNWFSYLWLGGLWIIAFLMLSHKVSAKVCNESAEPYPVKPVTKDEPVPGSYRMTKNHPDSYRKIGEFD